MSAPRILVVDDEPDIEALITQKFRRRIRKGEIDFVFAHDGEHALEVLAANPDVEIVLSDINMPRMDGLTLLERLNGLESQVKTVIVSAYGDMGNIRTAMNRGAFDFVTKPIEFDDLETTIAKTVEHLQLFRQLRDAKDEAERAHAILSRYFSPTIVEALSQDPEAMRPHGERRSATFLFTDLANFTPLVESSASELIVRILNEYLDGMTETVFAHGGTVMKIVGDAVQAIFGAPVDDPEHARRAVECALAIDAFATGFRDKMKGQGVDLGVTRIGVNTGDAIIGNFGGEAIFRLHRLWRRREHRRPARAGEQGHGHPDLRQRQRRREDPRLFRAHRRNDAAAGQVAGHQVPRAAAARTVRVARNRELPQGVLAARRRRPEGEAGVRGAGRGVRGRRPVELPSRSPPCGDGRRRDRGDGVGLSKGRKRLQIRNVQDHYDDWQARSEGHLAFRSDAAPEAVSIAGHPVLSLQFACDPADACVSHISRTSPPMARAATSPRGMLRAPHRDGRETGATHRATWPLPSFRRGDAAARGERVRLADLAAADLAGLSGRARIGLGWPAPSGTTRPLALRPPRPSAHRRGRNGVRIGGGRRRLSLPVV